MDCHNNKVDVSPYEFLLSALRLIPIFHYFLAFSFIFLLFLYNFLEIHFFHDLFFTGLRGDSVNLVYASGSDLYKSVAANFCILHGRLLSLSISVWTENPSKMADHHAAKQAATTAMKAWELIIIIINGSNSRRGSLS